jgi:hypothetical protein
MVALAAVAGCGASNVREPASSVKEPHEVWRSGQPHFLALMAGRVHGDNRTRCVWVGTRKSAIQIAWPKEYRVRFNPFRIERRDGRVVAREGGWIRSGGGEDSRFAVNPRCPHHEQSRLPGKWSPGSIEFWGKERPHA